MKNDFKVVIPAELEKSADGEWRVRGLASTEKVDQQGEMIVQKGIDLSPIDERKGVLNWDHQKGPENTIGLLDGYSKTDSGLYIEGRLFKNHSKAKAVREIMDSLSKGDKGRMGLSVEGRIIERDPKNPKIIKKCQINAVALTMNPVNQDSFADLVKSMSGAEEVDFNSIEENIVEDSSKEASFTAEQVVQIVQKALGIGAGNMAAPDSLSGGDAMVQSNMKEKKPKKKLKKMCKNLYKSNMLEILDKLQVLYPECSRATLWTALKDRLDSKFGDVNEGFQS